MSKASDARHAAIEAVCDKVRQNYGLSGEYREEIANEIQPLAALGNTARWLLAVMEWQSAIRNNESDLVWSFIHGLARAGAAAGRAPKDEGEWNLADDPLNQKVAADELGETMDASKSVANVTYYEVQCFLTGHAIEVHRAHCQDAKRAMGRFSGGEVEAVTSFADLCRSFYTDQAREATPEVDPADDEAIINYCGAEFEFKHCARSLNIPDSSKDE